MKVIDKRENNGILSLLWKGDSFIMEGEWGTGLFLHVGGDENDNTSIKAVNLKNGRIYSIDKNALVEPVDLTIEVYSRSTE